jgi:zinc resistance-associated protein
LRFCTAIYNLLIDDEETAMMGKKALMVVTALALTCSAAFAQQRFEGRVGPGMGSQPGPSAEDLGAFTDARVAALKAGLRLTPEQEKNWPAFEQAYRNLAKLRSDRFAAMRSQGPAADDQNMVDRLQRRADTIAQFGTALQDLAKAERPLYESLDDAQKRRFVAISRFMAPHRHFAMGQHGSGGHDDGPGFGRGGHGPRDYRE